jgi:hypothetical protein
MRTFFLNIHSLTLVLTLSMSAALLSACGGGPGNAAAYQEGSDHCSSDFISDHFKVVSKSRRTSTKRTWELEALIDSFAAKYKDVVCKASVDSDESVYSSTRYVDVNADVKRWKEKLASIRAEEEAKTRPAPPAPHAPKYPGSPEAYDGTTRNCSQSFITDYNELISALRSHMLKRDREAAATELTRFEARYKDVECQATQGEAGLTSMIRVNEKVRQLRKFVSTENI